MDGDEFAPIAPVLLQTFTTVNWGHLTIRKKQRLLLYARVCNRYVN